MVLKPGFSARNAYVPGASDGKEYAPASFVIAVRVAFVPLLVADTVTPATAAPLASRASPSMEPNVWPDATAAPTRLYVRTTKRTREIIMDSCPPRQSAGQQSPHSLDL